jgi:hypothetical protein
VGHRAGRRGEEKGVSGFKWLRIEFNSGLLWTR